MTAQTDKFFETLNTYVMNKVKPCFAEQSKRDYETNEKPHLTTTVQGLPIPDLTDKDHNATIEIVIRPLVEDIVESALESLLERTPRSAIYSRADLDTSFNQHTTAEYAQELGLKQNEAQALIEAVKDALLDYDVRIPATIEFDGKLYELRRHNQLAKKRKGPELEVTRL